MGAVGAAAEDVVGFVEDELAFEVLELAAGGEERDRFIGFGDVVVFAQGEDFAIQTAKGGNEFGVGLWVVSHICGGKGAEEGEEMAGGKLKAGFGQFGGVGILDEVRGGFLGGAKDLEAFLGGKVILIAAILPAGKVLFGEGKGERWLGRLEGLDDGGIGSAVVEERIDFVAKGFGEAGDFAFATGG